MDHVNRFDLMKTAEFSQGVLSVGASEGHRRLEPRHLQHADARLLRRGLLMGSRNDGNVMPSLSEMTCQMVDHRADTSPTRRILARDHGDVHANNHTGPAFECH